MSLDGLVAETLGALNRAHGLFGDPPASGPLATDVGDTLDSAGRDTTNLGSQTSQMSGQWVAWHSNFTDTHSTNLTNTGSDYRTLGALLDQGTADQQTGRAQTGNVVTGAETDTNAIAPVTNTPAGQRALVSALKGRVDQQRNVLAAYQHRDAQLQNAIRTIGARNNIGSPGLGSMPSQQMGGFTPPSIGNTSLPPLSGLLGSARHNGAPPALARAAARPEPNVSGMPAGSGATAARAGLSMRGTPYVWGGTSPKGGIDCSGLTQAAWREAGVELPRTTYDQIKTGAPVPAGQVRAGDLIFSNFSAPGVPEHVQLAISSSEVVEAQQTGVPVKVSPMPASFVARRPG